MLINDDDLVMRTSQHMSPVTPSPDDQEHADSRRPGRTRTDLLYCRHGKKKFGQVIDLSRNGMRVVRKGFFRVPKGARTELLLCWEQTQVTVCSRVAWERKIGMFTYLLGMEFIELTPVTVAVLQSVAAKARTSLVIGSVEHDFASAHKQANG